MNDRTDNSNADATQVAGQVLLVNLFTPKPGMIDDFIAAACTGIDKSSPVFEDSPKPSISIAKTLCDEASAAATLCQSSLCPPTPCTITTAGPEPDFE
jgi:hypothetical protein